MRPPWPSFITTIISALDSPYDYDPVWSKCLELRVAPTFHSAPIGRGTRGRSAAISTTNWAAFRKRSFASGCSSGVTRRFPDLRCGFLEGGAAWATALYARLVEHWKKRNYDSMQRLNPARIDAALLGGLVDEFGHERLKPYRDKIVKDLILGDRMEELDDWRDCKTAGPKTSAIFSRPASSSAARATIARPPPLSIAR